MLRTRPEAGQAAKFFVVAGHPLTHLQELESCTSDILLKALRDVSCVPKEACEHELEVRIVMSDRLAANMKAERELCRERGPGWLPLRASCDVHRVSTLQSRSLDHVKDLVSRLVHLSLSLCMSEHVKRFRACMRTVVEGACSAEAADYRSYIWELFLARGQFAAKRRSLLWAKCNGDWRNKNAIEHYVDPTRPFAQTRSYISRQVVNAFLSAVAPRQPSVFPRHSVDGLRPRLRRGRLVALRPQCLARQLSGLPCVVWCQARPTFRASVRAICGSGVARLSSSAAPARWL